MVDNGKNDFKIELFWAVLSLLLGYLVNFLIFGKEALTFNHTVDINIHDTYFVFQNYGSIAVFIVFTFFAVFLGRIIFYKRKNIWTGIWFVISIINFIIALYFLISIVDSFAMLNRNMSTTVSGEYPSSPATEILSKFSTILKYIEIGLLVLLAVISFKIGVKFQSKKLKHS